MLNKQLEYQEYLKTDHWKELREKTLNNPYYGRPQECFVCFATKSPHVHHLTYRRKGKERDDDLLLLCNECHSRVHTDSRGQHTLNGTFSRVFELKMEKLSIFEDRTRKVRKKRKISRVQQSYNTKIEKWKSNKKKKKRKIYNAPARAQQKEKHKESLSYLGTIAYYKKYPQRHFI